MVQREWGEASPDQRTARGRWGSQAARNVAGSAALARAEDTRGVVGTALASRERIGAGNAGGMRGCGAWEK